MLNFFIWGVGVRGKRLYDILGNDRVTAFIDNDDTVEGIDGKSVFDFDTYADKFSEEVVAISNHKEISIVRQMTERSALHFLLLNECPDQMQTNCDMNRIREYIENKAGYAGVAIYGVSIYSVLVYDWLQRHGNRVYLIKDNSCGENVDVVVFKLKQQDYKVVDCQEELPSNITKLFVAIATTEKVETNLERIDIFDFTDVFTEHWNPALKKFRDIHKNKRCFIVATGASLRMEDLECLRSHNEICISMNRIFYGFGETDWRPDYYVVSDKRISKVYKPEIVQLEAKEKFISDNDDEFWSDCVKENIYKFHAHNNSNLSLLFSDDISKCFQNGSTVTFIAIQLAAYMGFCEIYLLGVDHSYGTEVNAPERYFYGDKDVKAPKMKMVPEDLIYLERNYKTAERYSRKHGFRIYNATRGGNLEVFERKKFDELFG